MKKASGFKIFVIIYFFLNNFRLGFIESTKEEVQQMKVKINTPGDIKINNQVNLYYFWYYIIPYYNIVLNYN